MNKLRINLLKDELVTVKTWLNLTNVVRTWAAIFIICTCFSIYLQYNYSALNSQYASLKKKNIQLSNQLEQYEDVLSTRVTDPKLVNKLATLKFALQNKQVLHRQLTDHTLVQVSGFADVMTELADFHNREISLRKIIISNGQINLYGLSRNADSVPNWLSGLSQSRYMAGRSFTQFNLSVNDDGDTNFIVQSGVVNVKESK
ncbi:hypothetical protein AADZ86_07865 [Colwelliaceae bacterium BS250]